MKQVLLGMLYGLIVGFIIGAGVFDEHYKRRGQEEMLRGNWLIHADTVAVDTTIIKYVKIK